MSLGTQLLINDKGAMVALRDSRMSQQKIAKSSMHNVANMQLSLQGPGLKKMAQWVWRQVTPITSKPFINPLPQRLAAVIHAQGSYTKY